MPDLLFTDPRLAALYDLGNGGGIDRDFYAALAGKPPTDILDLGCGTGLLCHVYAERGHRVVGVDPAEAMLDVARAKPNGDAIEWVNSTAETFQSARRFDLIIMTGHAFQCLLSDAEIERGLATMARHLKPDGIAVFESRNPAIDWDQQWAREVRLQTEEGPVMCRRRMIDKGEAGCLSFAWDYEIGGDVVTSESTLRFASDTNIIRLAAMAGLSLKVLSGDWTRGPFDPASSKEMIFTFERQPDTP